MEIVEAILAVMRPGPVLVIGAGSRSVTRKLLNESIPAVFLGEESECRPAWEALATAPWDDGHFGCVVCWDALNGIPERDVVSHLNSLTRLTKGPLLLRVSAQREGGRERDRAWWEERAFAAGLRKHPSYYHLLPFEQLETDQAPFLVPLERIPDDAVARYPLASLRAERDLHMDMTREAGRRSDAHVTRYLLAAKFIHPGDTVVDAACGLGYGTHILRCNSQGQRFVGIDSSASAIAYATASFGHAAVAYECSDAQALSSIANHSVDVVVSFETLEHLVDPGLLIAEAARVLKPGGRLIASVPNDWADESGCDPNPYHFHVYDWRRFTAQLTPFFLLEHLFAQVAGGGPKLADQKRRLYEVPADPDQAPDSEWCLAVAMLDPVTRAHVPYRETVYPYIDEPENVLSFARDYTNPWIVRAMVALGTRTASCPLLMSLAQRVLETSAPDTPDHGAALAVLGYRLIEDSAPPAQVRDMVLAIDRFFGCKESPCPHHYRWRISLIFLKGKLLASIGALDESRAAFAACAALDCRGFSATLGTKTTEAAFLAGWTAYCQGDQEAARMHWRQGLENALDLIRRPEDFVGRLEQPLAFLPYDLMDIAAALHKCANGLAATYSVDAASRAIPVTALRSCWKTMIDQQHLRLNACENERNALRHTVRHLHAAAQLDWGGALQFEEIERARASLDIPGVFNLVAGASRCMLHSPFTAGSVSSHLMTAIGPSHVAVRNGNQWSYPLSGGFMFTPNPPGEAPHTLTWIGVPMRDFDWFSCDLALAADCGFEVGLRALVTKNGQMLWQGHVFLRPGEHRSWANALPPLVGLCDMEISVEMASGAHNNHCSGVTVSGLHVGHVGRAGRENCDRSTSLAR